MWCTRSVVLPIGILLLGGCAGLRQRAHGLLPGSEPSLASPALPEDATALGHFFRGQVALSRNDSEAALHEFEAAVAADPGASFLRVRLAGLYVRAGLLQRALEQCQLALAAEPNNPEALGLLGGVLSSLGRDDEAAATYERLLHVDPQSQDPYLYLGALYAKRGETDRAGAPHGILSLLA